MGRLVPLLLLGAISFPTVAAAQDPAALVAGREQDWATASVSKNATVLADLLHQDFRLVPLYALELGTVPKDDYLALHEGAPEWRFTSMTPQSIKVEMHEGVAVATVEMQVGWPAEIDMPPGFRFTDLWVESGGIWRVLVRYSEIPQDRGAAR
jgi:hypothetical protein